MILAGDIGGTKTNLALFERCEGGLEPKGEATFPSREHGSLDEIARAFLADAGQQPTIACFGVAGPVLDNRCQTTNLPWRIDGAALSKDLGIARVMVINDLEATAYGVSLVSPDQVVVLNEGTEPSRGNGAVIAAGTGLGEAGLFWDGSRHIPFACEGGHTDFAPRDAVEIALRDALAARHGHVSWERIVSGPGLHALYDIIARRMEDEGTPDARDPEVEQAVRTGDDPAPAIARAALASPAGACGAALDRFVVLYGAEAGNLALKMLATGGLWVAGGIAPKILPRLRAGGFMEAFLAKGRMRPLLERIPVRVVLAEETALLGAALCAWRHAPAKHG